MDKITNDTKALRFFVEKKDIFNLEAESLRRELNDNLGLDIRSVRVVSVYDVFGMNPQSAEHTAYSVFGQAAVDKVTVSADPSEWEKISAGNPVLATEFLPGQFDQRAASALDCVKLVDRQTGDIEIRSSRMIIFDKSVGPEVLDLIRDYVINPVEAREKDLSVLVPAGKPQTEPVKVLNGFCEISSESDAAAYVSEKGLAMNASDLLYAIEYFRNERRDPTETELRILDTYWSDHCRHTTFTTCLDDISVEESVASSDINRQLQVWKDIRHSLGRDEKPMTLMDLATVGMRYLRHTGDLDDLEQSEENNACSIFVDVDTDGAGGKERWLLQFKNETHNHPTEIEPFGGASTCLGGAIRDPLSGRAYVYQAMRVTGAADIYAPVAETLEGKLPQRLISRRAAAGYSSYGNQIGLATTHVREIYHPGYVAKRMEVGAVVGASRAADVRRESPVAGDIILMLGGRTGRDGIGGATGSSKQHTTESLTTCGSEVQKGNAPEERKIARLLRRPDVTRLIKKSNDFGAGGVSVAIGELAPGLDIWLDRVPLKYDGLNATEIAISESQERMAVVIACEDKDEFIARCDEENIEVTHVADVTDSGRMRLWYDGKTVADLSREFIDSAGAPRHTKAVIASLADADPFSRRPFGDTFEERMLANMADDNVTVQKGLVEMFDPTIGASTVLLPFGGKTQTSETQVSLQALPAIRKDGTPTTTSSMMAFGFNPELSAWSPYHGAAYAVVEAIAKSVAAGAEAGRLRFSYQEYFERMRSPQGWGKPLAALLGALKMQLAFKAPAIGGKDSMSGTFGNIDVPPTLIAFCVATLDRTLAVGTDFKAPGHYICLLRHRPLPDMMPDTDFLTEAYSRYNGLLRDGHVKSAWAIGFGGVAEGLAKMGFGNNIGCEVSISENDIFSLLYGSILFECDIVPDGEGFECIGKTTDRPEVCVNGVSVGLDSLLDKALGCFGCVYPWRTHDVPENVHDVCCDRPAPEYPGERVETPVVCLPVFDGTNCDYDMAAAFRREGAETRTVVFRNRTAFQIEESAERLAKAIDDCHILAVSGGFSAGDEPDGSGKYIAAVLGSDPVKGAIERLLARKGLILGICNGFQALVKSGLLPYGQPGCTGGDSPTLFNNAIGRHVARMVTTRVASTASPWLSGFTCGQLHTVAASHGEGRFMACPELLRELERNGQIAFQYADSDGHATSDSPSNPNGSMMAIEGIISPDGLILGKMAHSERYAEGLMKNISGDKNQNLFAGAVGYFRKTNNK